MSSFTLNLFYNSKSALMSHQYSSKFSSNLNDHFNGINKNFQSEYDSIKQVKDQSHNGN